MIGLYRSSRAYSKLPLVCLLAGEFDRKPFADTDIIFLQVPRIVNYNYNPERREFSVILSNLWVFGLSAVTRLVFLDCDVTVQNNIDESFDYPAPAFAPDYVDHTHTQRFNSGVFVVEPDVDEFMRLVSYAGKAKSYDNADQGLLNGYFCANHHWLPSVYTTLKHRVYYADGVTREKDDIAIIHYIMKEPWEMSYRELVDAKLVTVEREWTKYLTKEDLLRLIEHWRKEVFILHERDGFNYRKENKRLRRKAKRLFLAVY